MNETDIANALTARLTDAALGYPIAWQNKDASPARPYLEVQHVRVGRQDRTLTGTKPTSRGYIMVTIVAATNKFATPSNVIADQVTAVFPKGLRLPATGGVVVVNKPSEALTAFKDGSDFRTPVRIDYETEE